jgi:NADH-quinone oxidoreductase subunit L
VRPTADPLARLASGIVGTAHAASRGAGVARGPRSGWQLGRCGERIAGERNLKVQRPVAVGAIQQLYVGPTVSFREIRDQLSVEDPRIADKEQRRVVAWNLASGELFGIGLLIFVTFGFFIGATGKSAQIPLYIWLPDAMAGPTPVSALIHAATMVTAGVYMVARLNFIFILSPEGMTLVAFVGAATALAAATMGLFQYDIKKVLAYSTVSQLGYMFVGVGVGAYWVGIYHLLTHAFFKACLFLGSGSVIHGMHYVHAHGHGASHAPRDLRTQADPTDPQDMRNMGGLARLMPSTRTTYLIACLAIAGIPGFSGFFSKDEILWQAFSSGNIAIKNLLIWGMCAAAALCTAFYMFRSYYLTFYGQPPSEGHVEHVKESPGSMVWVLWFLAGGAILIGLIGLPALWLRPVLGPSYQPWIESFLAPSMAVSEAFQREARAHGHLLEWGLMAFSVLLAVGGIFLARYWYKDLGKTAVRIANLKDSYRSLHTLLFNKYYVDEIYHLLVVRPFIAGTRLLGWLDLRLVDGLVNASAHGLKIVASIGGWIDHLFVDGAVNGVADTIIGAGRRLRRVQTGRVNTYVMGIAFGVVILLFVVWIVTPMGGK